MKTCPAIRSSDFDRLRNAPDDHVERDFAGLVSRLHEFLNESSVVHDLQSHRSKWTSPRDAEAFRNFKADPSHWYTFHHGGRSEAQLNIGMFPDHLRVGLGFEFTEKEHGNPRKARFAYSSLLQAIQADKEGFNDVIDEVPLELEFYPSRDGGLEILGPSSVMDTLFEPPREPTYMLVGRMLRPDVDQDILGDGERLGDEINRVFSIILPWWKAANRGGR